MTIVIFSDYNLDMQKINVSEFKAVCLRLLEQVRQSGEPIEILKNGKPLAVVYPAEEAKKKAFGVLKDSLVGEVKDLTKPLNEINWDALK